MKNLIIIGSGGFSREVAWLVEDINEKENEWNLLGFIDDDEKKHGQILNGYKVLGGLEYVEERPDTYYICAIANSKIRKRIVERCERLMIKPAILIHPSVIMSNKNSQIGMGSIICAGCIITVNVKLEKHVIVNIDSTIGHDAKVEEFSTIYPSVNISGNCNIGKCVEIGTGTQIIQGKNIGENSIIGAGSVVVKDIEINCTAVGVPAKVIKRIII